MAVRERKRFKTGDTVKLLSSDARYVVVARVSDDRWLVESTCSEMLITDVHSSEMELADQCG